MANTVVISGRVVRYAERAAGNKNLGTFDISVPNPGRKGKEEKPTYSYFSVDVWEPNETLSANLNTPKTKVLVVGRLKQDSWKDKTGANRSTVKIIASEVSVLEDAPAGQEPGNYAQQEPEPEPVPVAKPAPKPVVKQPSLLGRAPVAKKPAPPPVQYPVEEEPEDPTTNSDIPENDIPF